MNTEQDLINKLLISKKIMEKHNDMGRGQSAGVYNTSPLVEEYQPVQGNYNIPQEYLSEGQLNMTQPSSNLTKPMEVTNDKILGSKLPDEIKKLMMEHPIQQPTNSLNTSTLSNELVEKASRLMNVDAKGERTNNTEQRKQSIKENTNFGISADDIRSIVRETITEVLKENGLLTESTKKTNELFKFRVGHHLFEGKLTKVRKISE
jgi:hypothetical protein